MGERCRVDHIRKLTSLGMIVMRRLILDLVVRGELGSWVRKGVYDHRILEVGVTAIRICTR